MIERLSTSPATFLDTEYAILRLYTDVIENRITGHKSWYNTTVIYLTWGAKATEIQTKDTFNFVSDCKRI